MPTGYTAAILEDPNLTFKDFALTCARAFGALISLRDEPLDTPIPDSLQENDYYANRLDEAKKALAHLMSLTYEQIAAAAKADYATTCERYAELREERRNNRLKLEAMLAKVEAWTPPTADHIQLKSFMIEQINSTIGFDGSDSFYNDPAEPTPQEWFNETKAKLERDIEYNTEQQRNESVRTAERNAWIKALRESLQ